MTSNTELLNRQSFITISTTDELREPFLSTSEAEEKYKLSANEGSDPIFKTSANESMYYSTINSGVYDSDPVITSEATTTFPGCSIPMPRSTQSDVDAESLKAMLTEQTKKGLQRAELSDTGKSSFGASDADSEKTSYYSTLADAELIRCFRRYDRNERGWLGKTELMHLLDDWISDLKTSDTLLINFRRTEHERALKLKNFLDTDKSGRITEKKFMRIKQHSIWKEISPNAIVDPKYESEQMWSEVFRETSNKKQISDKSISVIWYRY
eukprot:UN25614